MLKKIIKLFVILITLFYFNLDIVLAYEYIDKSNETLVRDMINEIYDSKQQYEDLAGGYTEVDVIHNAKSTSYWWPIGSS